MIQPNEYSNLRNISQSDLKLLIKNPKRFYNTIEMGERIESYGQHFIIGDLVDCMLTCPENMKNYHTDGVSCSETVQQIIENAIRLIYNREEDSQEIQKMLSNVDHAREYLIQAGREKEWNSKYGDDALFNAIKKQGGRYFELKAKYPEKIIVSATDYAIAKRCVEAIEKDPITGPIVNHVNKSVQLILTGSYSNTETKGLLDLCIIDDERKTIYPYDIKTVRNMSEFIGNYHAFGYGYQGSWYTDLLEQNYPEYKIAPFRFIVASTDVDLSKDASYDDSPLVYTMSKVECKLYKEGGYDKFGNKVTGWTEAILNLEWHRRTNNWQYPRSYYQHKEMYIDSNAPIPVLENVL